MNWIIGQLLICLKLFIFPQLSLNLGNWFSRLVIVKFLLNSPGLLFLFSLINWVSCEPKIIRSITVSAALLVRSHSGSSEKFFLLSTWSFCNFFKLIDAIITLVLTCLLKLVSSIFSMRECEPVILSLVIIQLTIVILLLLLLITAKLCMVWGMVFVW